MASGYVRLRWYDSIFLRIIPPLAALVIKLLLITCRVVRVEGEERYGEALSRSGGGASCATWHQRMSYHFHYFGSRHITMMISRSRDGEYAARTARWLGFRDVRGSSTRGGRGALREMIRQVRNGERAGFLADGPQGPARLAKMGAVIVAKEAQVPLVGILWGADRCWVLNSWDLYLVPKPFARVAIFYTDPIHVPADAEGDELESFRRLFEQRMNDGARWCDEQFGPERPWRNSP
jgi:lysophospholipid acyltransferase (LPLAT)-like uncharacterized protein